MSAGMWERLGIGETSDIAVIRSAYAARAKECHPEEHPEEFQKLQAAYKAAVKYAKGLKKQVAVEAPEQNRQPEMRGEEPPKQKRQSEMRGEEIPKQKRQPEPKGEETPEERGQPSDREAEFDYGEVEWEEVSIQFFRELHDLALNPYMMNDPLCWELFLKKPEYQRLYPDDAFRRNVVVTMYHLHAGWRRGTIRYFDGWLKQYQQDMADPETELRPWRRRRNALFEANPLSFAYRKASKEQSGLHGYILSRVRRTVGSDDLTDAEVLACYMELYLDYAKRDPGKIERMNRDRTSVQSMVIAFVLVVIFWGFLMVHVANRSKNNPPASPTDQLPKLSTAGEASPNVPYSDR